MTRSDGFPDSVVSAEWLHRHLDDPDLRVFECTTSLDYLPAGSDAPYRVVSGRATYLDSHIPGAAFLDIDGDLSADSPPHLRFTLPEPDILASILGQQGIGDRIRVVLYTRGKMQWATRVWWMLRWLGFDDAAVLNGGFEGWMDGSRPVSSGVESHAPVELSTSIREGLFAARADVERALADDHAILVNALDADLHRGENARYGRPGRIRGSVNVPATALVGADNLLVADAEARARFVEVGVTPGRRAVLYCGGGIAATLDAFVLHRLGYTDVTVYDASLSEWARDPLLPMECDVAPVRP